MGLEAVDKGCMLKTRTTIETVRVDAGDIAVAHLDRLRPLAAKAMYGKTNPQIIRYCVAETIRRLDAQEREEQSQA